MSRYQYNELINSLSLEAKVSLLTGATGFTLAADPAIGLGTVAVSDGPTGVRGLKFDEGPEATLLPNATLLASAWNEDSAREAGRILAEEALAQHVHVVLGPTINLHRTCLGGRLFEAYSEDPLLSGRLAASYVSGLQDAGVGACLKHLVGNESETMRHSVNSVIDEATLRELYLLPFEIAVTDANPWSIMSAYNRVNGVAATEQDHVQNTIVKGEWGYEGLIMSDWSATTSAGPAANAGLDLVMPGPHGPWGARLVHAVESGEVDEAVIDDHLRRVLRLADRVGALGTPRDFPADLPTPVSPIRREQMTRLAAAGITVLTNEDDALPLARGASVALIGRHAVETVGMGGGSAQVRPPHQVSAAEGMTSLLGSAVTVTDGVPVHTRPVPARAGFLRMPGTEEHGVEFLLYAEDGTLLDVRHGAHSTAMIGVDDALPERATRVAFRACVASQGDVELGVLGVGSWTLRAGGEEFAAELDVSGAGFGEEILTPPARVWTVRVGSDLMVEGHVLLRPASADNPNAGVGLFGLIGGPAPRPVDEILSEAAAAARAADVAVVVVGLTDDEETEAVDKQTLRLPGDQDALVSRVAAAASRTVVVVNAATPVLMPWLHEVDAVLWAGLPGQEAGHAIAATLLGDLEPSGRLVTTFPREDGAAPAWSVTPDAGDLEYAEGTYVGYRGHYAGRAPAPAFWLGHGLGYTTWSYGQPQLMNDDPRSVRVSVTNTGRHHSREVVQLYWEPAAADQPVRLVGWASAEVDPGATADVIVTGDARMWRRWDSGAQAWTHLPDSGRFLVARGLGDVRGTLDLGDPC